MAAVSAHTPQASFPFKIAGLISLDGRDSSPSHLQVKYTHRDSNDGGQPSSCYPANSHLQHQAWKISAHTIMPQYFILQCRHTLQVASCPSVVTARRRFRYSNSNHTRSRVTRHQGRLQCDALAAHVKPQALCSAACFRLAFSAFCLTTGTSFELHAQMHTCALFSCCHTVCSGAKAVSRRNAWQNGQIHGSCSCHPFGRPAHGAGGHYLCWSSEF